MKTSSNYLYSIYLWDHRENTPFEAIMKIEKEILLSKGESFVYSNVDTGSDMYGVVITNHPNLSGEQVDLIFEYIFLSHDEEGNEEELRDVENKLRDLEVEISSENVDL